MSVRLPNPGQDEGKWGELLNNYLLTSHTAEGRLKPGVVSTQSISDNVVTTPKIQNQAITADKLASDLLTQINNNQGPPAGAAVPTGGSAGQVLAKSSGSDYDTSWVDQSESATLEDAVVTSSKVSPELANLISLNVYRTAASNPNWISNSGAVVNISQLHALGYSLAFWCELGLEPAIGTANGQAKEGRDAVYQINNGA